MPPVSYDKPSITIQKTISYRGAAEEFSNRYFFSGTTPSTSAGWKALFDAIVAAEQPTVTSAVTWVGGLGYVADTATSVWSYNYAAAGVTAPYGSMTLGTMIQLPGDAACRLRFTTADRSTKGKPIYLQKYLHPAYIVSGTPDTVAATQRTALATFAGKLIDGTLPGSFHLCRPNGGDALAASVPLYVTTRTLKHRGKRGGPS